METLQTFELFPRLPYEIREAIWKAALPQARAVKLLAENIDLWDRPPCKRCPCIEHYYNTHEAHEEFQYYVDLYGYRGLHDCKDLSIHENGYTCEEVYGANNITRFRELCSNETYGEDTRSIAENDIRMIVHMCARGPDGRLKRQRQLQKYGFTTSRLAPTIRHTSNREIAYYQGYSQNGTKYASRERDVRSLTHSPYDCYGELHTLRFSPGFFSRPRRKFQRQLQRYGFTSSRPNPHVRHLEPWEDRSVSRGKRYFSSSGPPALLHVCRNSRGLAQQSGYTIAFATYHAPAQTWFNFQTNFLCLDRDDWWSPYEQYDAGVRILLEDRRRVRKLAVKNSYYEERDFFQFVGQFENLWELVILVTDNTPSRHGKGSKLPVIDDWMIIDSTVAEVLGPRSEFTPPEEYGLEWQIRAYNKKNPNGPPFYQGQAQIVEQKLGERQTRLLGNPNWQCPKVRFRLLTDGHGIKKLQVIRGQYWRAREEWPPPDYVDEILRELMDEKITQRLPSPFDR